MASTAGYSANTMLKLNTAEADRLFADLKSTLTPQQYHLLLARTMERVGKSVRTMVAREVTHDYAIPYGKVLKAISSPITMKGAGITCVLKVTDVRGKIARKGKGAYQAVTTGAGGRRITAKKFRKTGARGGYSIHAKIVKAGLSLLPWSEGEVHFMVSSGAHEGEVFVRLKNGAKYSRLVVRKDKNGNTRTYRVMADKIRPGVGIGVPQMPMTRSADEIQRKAVKMLMDRAVHEHRVIIEGLARKYRGATKA